jgi:molybdopterin/thiamine biosynthesis adenylyltransferase/proteasome lid subunit RPN8/RPN11
MTTLALTQAIFDELRRGLKDRDETAWVLVARVARDGQLLLARTVHPVGPAAYLQRGPHALQITSPGFVPAFKAARLDDAIPVFVHTHPNGRPARSRADIKVDRQLHHLAIARGLAGYGSLILAGDQDAPMLTGRLWLGDARATKISTVRVAGERLTIIRAAAGGVAQPPPALFDRQLRAFGADGQRLLGMLQVGVVGAGGTGSAVIEQLARLGVGAILCFDDDTVDESNLTRIHGSARRHVGTLKVKLAKRAAQACGTGTRVTARPVKITSASAVLELAGCDVILGCTDDHAGRLVLSRLAYHYLVPVIDCGVTIQSDRGRVGEITGRVTYVAPGSPCLTCRGQVDALTAGQQMRNADERAALVQEGYAPGLEEAAPAVVAFTTAVAALAVNELLARLFGYGAEHPGQLLARFGARELRHAGRPAQPGHSCTDPAQWGLGDSDPPLGILGL